MICSLCSSDLNEVFCHTSLSREYYKCEICEMVSLDASFYLDFAEEKARYLEHNNDVLDSRYQDFVKPMVDQICDRFRPDERGLDFGAGTGPVASYLLEQKGYKISKYDPFFWPCSEALQQQYHFIFAIEVIEHLSQVRSEIAKLREMLLPSGVLFLMTEEYPPSHQEFKSWYYHQDPTHISFLNQTSFEFLKQNLGFKKLSRPTPRVWVLES